MVLPIVKIAEGEGERLVLLELQGKILGLENVPNEGESGIDEELLLGDLQVNDDGETATLLIGNQQLNGRRIALPRPLVLLQQDREAITDTNQNTTEEQRRVQIAGLIHEKFLFDSRPITNVSSSK